MEGAAIRNRLAQLPAAVVWAVVLATLAHYCAGVKVSVNLIPGSVGVLWRFGLLRRQLASRTTKKRAVVLRSCSWLVRFRALWAEVLQLCLLFCFVYYWVRFVSSVSTVQREVQSPRFAQTIQCLGGRAGPGQCQQERRVRRGC